MDKVKRITPSIDFALQERKTQNFNDMKTQSDAAVCFSGFVKTT